MALPVRPAYRLYQWIWIGLDLVYPPICGGCEQEGARWCPTCDAKTIQISSPICSQCGQKNRSDALCDRCRNQPPAFDALRSYASYEDPLGNAIRRLKYQRDVGLGEALAEYLFATMVQAQWEVDLIAPVPLSIARQAERGYNQAALLARPLALASGHRYSSRALRRVRETRSQVGLNLTDRFLNVRQAFWANPQLVHGRRILIIDDVATSGATLAACADALKLAGAVAVWAITLARA